MLRFLKIPYFLSVHGALERDALRVSRIRKLVFRAVFGDRLVRSAVAVIVASNKESASVRQGFPEIEIYLIPVGVIPMSDSSSECSAKGSRSYALVLSRLDRSKGLDLLIEAWASQRRERVLLVAGPDERGYRKELEEIVLTLGLAEAVFFIGEVRGAEKWKLIRDAEMLILPSLSENFGIVVVEALAVGTLVLTTINTPWTTVGVENGCLCVTPDVSGLADGIAALDSLSEEHRQAASMRARNYARRFDWRFIDVTSYLDLASRYV
jgi:glycosyltransferase involved in cell wall biosynthesis